MADKSYFKQAHYWATQPGAGSLSVRKEKVDRAALALYLLAFFIHISIFYKKNIFQKKKCSLRREEKVVKKLGNCLFEVLRPSFLARFSGAELILYS